jgi:hypothetical protein
MLISEQQPLDQDNALRDNDLEIRKALREIYSRGNLARNYRTVSAAETLDHRIGAVLLTSGGYTLTLPRANYWGTTKSPVLHLYHGGSSDITIATTAPDAFDSGVGTFTLRTGEKVTLTSDANVTWIINRHYYAEGQYKFPATQNASTDANTLDDYEEGTWTPTVVAGAGTITTYTANGNYTKIGNRVFFSVNITISNNGTGANYLQFTLPIPVGLAHTYSVYGREISGLNFGIAGFNITTTAVVITKYDGTYPGSTGGIMTIGGHYFA